MSEILFEAKNIYKSFPGVKALKGVDFVLRTGEIVSLIGTNGAGKSTFCNIIAGIYEHDEGEILIGGKPVRITSPNVAEGYGIGIVHQEPTLVPQLTVTENMFLGKEKLKKGQLLDFEGMKRESMKTLEALGFHLDVTRKVSTLTLVEKEIVGIATSMLLDPKILMLDEVTAPLNLHETEYLFTVIRDLKKRGIGIIFISHKIRETLQISDRVVVFRDGQKVSEMDVGPHLTERHIISPMLGETITHDIENVAHSEYRPEASEVLLEVRDLKKTGAFRGIHFTLHRGEIVGFAGLKGAGVTDLFYSLQGATRFDSGEVWLEGERVAFATPQKGIARGVGMVTNDRQHEGLALQLDVQDNITISSLYKLLTGLRLLDLKKIAEKAEEYVKKLSIKTPSIRQSVGNLSGGNQQKIVIAKWLLRDMNVLIVDEPTRGVDVKAKSEIYRLLIKQKEEGKGILVYSPETRELLNICDRILIAVEGRIIGEVRRGTEHFNEAHILEVVHAA
jgi:ABC-type sugar transport system ATPase subunit